MGDSTRRGVVFTSAELDGVSPTADWSYWISKGRAPASIDRGIDVPRWNDDLEQVAAKAIEQEAIEAMVAGFPVETQFPALHRLPRAIGNMGHFVVKVGPAIVKLQEIAPRSSNLECAQMGRQQRPECLGQAGDKRGL